MTPEQRSAVAQLRMAILNAGSHPRYHHEVMARHRREWPTLWAAIDRLLREADRG